jgi:hypothetical protein
MKTISMRSAVLFLLSCSFACSFTHAQGLYTVQVTSFKAESRNGNVGLTWKTQSEEDLRQYEIEYSSDGRYYKNLGFIPARNTLNGNFYEFENQVSYNDSAFYRLKIIDNKGRWLYTEPVLYHVNKTTAFFVYPSLITSRIINIFVNDPFNTLEVVNMSGEVMLKQNLSGKTGRIDIPMSPTLSGGVYIVQLSNYDKKINQKVIIQ